MVEKRFQGIYCRRSSGVRPQPLRLPKPVLPCESPKSLLRIKRGYILRWDVGWGASPQVPLSQRPFH